jgi:subtilisin family serine protease
MRRLWVLVAAGGLVGPFGAALVTPAASASERVQTVVVKMAWSGVRPSTVLGSDLGAGVSTAAAPQGRYMMRVPAGQVSAVLAQLRADPRVSFAEVPQAVHATATPNDLCYVTGCPAQSENGPVFANQAYLNTVDAPAAWDITKGAGERVAVLDTGVDTSHPDLAGKIHSFVNVCQADDAACAGNADDNGHGTHVTGIAAADTNNHLGVAAIGWSIQVDMYKVLDSQGSGNTADVATAIYEAVAAGDRVISMSLSNFACQYVPQDCGPDPDEGAAVEYALAHNVVVVAAAGNGGSESGPLPGLNAPTYPGSFPGVLSVAATDNNRVVQGFSEWGTAANIAAPGAGIVSTWNNAGYFVLSGTSMATPQVAAAAALMIAHRPSLSGPQVTELLETTARSTSGGHPINGGVLDVAAALRAEAHPPHLYEGYDIAGADGSVYVFGSMVAFGDLSGRHLNRPIVGISASANGLGYWMDASDGGVFPLGNAHFYGSTGSIRLNKPVVGMAATPDGKGYWLVASDGGIFEFGDAHFYGSTGSIRLNKPVVGMAATPDGKGYWLVASDGGIFEFGDAHFYGSTGNVRLNKPVIGMAPAPLGNGYTLVGSDGGVFDFGSARFWGSAAAFPIPAPAVGVTS